MTWIVLASLVHAAAPAEVAVEVLLRGAPATTTPVVSATWLGEERTLELSDDGRVPGDRPGDSVFCGVWTGEPVRVLPVRIGLRTAGGALNIASFYEVIGEGSTDLAYVVELGEPPSVRRAASALPTRSAEVSELGRVAATVGWSALVLGYVAWLVGRSAPPGRPERK